MASYDARMDESLGMRNGKESSKSQSYKSRRDESRGMSGVMGHASKPMKCDPFEAQKMGKMKGYPKMAYDYKYKK